MPPEAAMAAASSFVDLDAVSETFGRFREAHGRTMHSAASAAPPPPFAGGRGRGAGGMMGGGRGGPAADVRNGKQQQQHQHQQRQVPSHQLGVAADTRGRTAVVADVAGAREDATANTDADADASSYAGGHFSYTFARSLLAVADPSSQLLSASDARRCLDAFLASAASALVRERTQVAAAYRIAVRLPPAADERILESLRDPEAALSDAGLNDAAVLMLASTLRVAIVVRPRAPIPMHAGGAPALCCVFPPSAGPGDPAVLVAWKDQTDETPEGAAAGAYQLVDCGGATLADVRRRLVAEGGAALAASLRETAMKRLSAPALVELAARVAVMPESIVVAAATPGARRRAATKADIFAELVVLGGAPRAP